MSSFTSRRNQARKNLVKKRANAYEAASFKTDELGPFTAGGRGASHYSTNKTERLSLFAGGDVDGGSSLLGSHLRWKPSSFLEAMVPPGNFTMLLALVVGCLWLTGDMKTFDSCSSSGDVTDKACIALVTEEGRSCKTASCMAVPISLIVIAGWWFVLQLGGINSWVREFTRGSDWKAALVVLPIIAGLIVIFAFAMVIATSAEDTRITLLGVSNDKTSSYQVINVLLLLFVVAISATKCEDLVGGRWSPTLACLMKE
jgi:hypothetical protein